MRNCFTCKHKGNKYCKYFKTPIILIQESIRQICMGYKKRPNKPISNQIKKKSIKQEKRLAKDLGAKRTPQSGAKLTSPSDMVKGNYVIESKATNKASISLKKEWFSQLKQSPINFGKIPTLILEFSQRERYVVLDEKDFINLIREE